MNSRLSGKDLISKNSRSWRWVSFYLNGSNFQPNSKKNVSVMNRTTCSSDPFPSKLLMSYLPTIIDIITHLINICISTSVFSSSCKSAIVLPLIKKPGLGPQVLKNYRPVSNLSFLSKLIDNLIFSHILTHIADNDLIDKFLSAYRCGHSTETALLQWLERETGHIWFY